MLLPEGSGLPDNVTNNSSRPIGYITFRKKYDLKNYIIITTINNIEGFMIIDYLDML